jgi:hypothetical protein
MPEQPPDPRDYDMRIPPPHDSSKQKGPETPVSDESESDRDTAKDTNVVRGDEKPQGRRAT